MKLDNLKAIRNKKKLTRDELANISGVSKNTIVALENGITNIEEVKLATLIKLAVALKVKAKKLLPDYLSKNI